MHCECALPCRDDPVTEADACCCAAFLLVAGAVAVFMANAGSDPEVWLPLAGAAILCGCVGRHYDAERLRNRPLDVVKAVRPLGP